MIRGAFFWQLKLPTPLQRRIRPPVKKLKTSADLLAFSKAGATAQAAVDQVLSEIQPALDKLTPAARFKDRVVELRRVKASELIDNPKNWRRHPDEQVGAMTSMMEQIGVAGASIGVIKPDGKIELLDGHLRKSISGEQLVPVLIVDLNEDEQKVFLASYDKLSELALGDPQALHDLLSELSIDEDSFFRKMMSDVEAELAVEVKQTGAAQKDVEGMALEPHEHYDYLVVMAQTTHEWNVLCDRLGLKPEARRKGMGTARAIRATRVLEKLNKGA
jgi:hypothetical protein